MQFFSKRFLLDLKKDTMQQRKQGVCKFHENLVIILQSQIKKNPWNFDV